MYRFQHIQSFWFLVALVVLAIVFLYHIQKRKKIIAQLGNEHTIQKLLPANQVKMLSIKTGLLAGVLFLLVIALANFQKLEGTEKITRKGVDVVIALDVSNSMLATDIQPNRLEKAKQLVTRLSEKLSNNRLGLVLFAGNSYVSVPLTIDANALKMNLSIANPSMLPTQGTSLSEAIKTSVTLFNKKEARYKSILLISDGEDHEEQAIKEAKNAAEQGIMINTIGIGSEAGATILNAESNEIKTDENGEKIITKLNEKILQDIANATEANYYVLQNTEEVSTSLANEINNADQTTLAESTFVNYRSYFQYFLLPALLLLCIEHIIPLYKKTKATA